MTVIRLVDDKKNWHKWWSARLLILALLCETLQRILPAWVDLLPDQVTTWVTPVLTTLALLARFIHQELK